MMGFTIWYSKENQPKRADSPSRASSSFFSSFFSSSFDEDAPPVADSAGVEEGVGEALDNATGAAFSASSMLTPPKAATNALTLTSSGDTPVDLITFFTLSSVISCFNLCNSKAAYTYSII